MKMNKLNKTILAAAIIFGASSMSHADQGHGKVTFTGSIIDAPCSITPDSIEQTVDMGQISNVALKDGGKSTPRNFSIDLENCTFVDDGSGNLSKNKVTVTFTGMESAANNGLLAITGTAKGASIAIADGDGQIIELGKATKPHALQNGKNTLSYAAYMQGDGGTTAVTEGEFQAVADFTLAYN
ncbi:fimbrial protein [Klebsiella aerogenes]|uniref:fimbrial protein n=2 Tax=Klebsiella aerogenes TaxID=548 RepID=UPI001C8C47D1|nr:fimbrial protein [Klebsiella aerogenes]MBX8999656.1 fimbrial protein [Klebsiella aerogenes]HBU8524502.1 fimbrial protein [Klebsiella aerogenes]HBV9945990.1 fimbrial protein [Klebsiella aerogenes]HDS5323691.1 fimbrial protein [Klebsiella aerogenes]